MRNEEVLKLGTSDQKCKETLKISPNTLETEFRVENWSLNKIESTELCLVTTSSPQLQTISRRVANT